ncbi:hypothetical protein ABBQ32_010081 [Trebouxia sp. C0010 RCD-2024]
MPAGQFFCSGVCQRVSCATTAGLNQFYPPTLNYSRATTSLFGSKTVIFVPYGSQLPLDLLPCPSLGSQANCSTVAFDRQDGDISGRIRLQPSATCAATQNVACPTCPIAQLQRGLCIPNMYVLNYTVTDSLGLSAEPLQLTVIVYESAQVQASLQLINQIPFNGDRAAARAQARTNIRQLTDASGSTANGAFRSAIAAALTSWWANEYNADATTRAAVGNFGAVDAFPFSIIQPTDVIVINTTYVANISEGTAGQFTYVSQAWIGIQGNTSAFATNLQRPGNTRRLLESTHDDYSTATQDPSLSAMPGGHSSAGAVLGFHRDLLQNGPNDISALETKLLAMAASFQGASPCNNTELGRAYYNGTSPVLNGERQFTCVNFSVGSNDNIDTYLTSNSASWVSLPLFHILAMTNRPVIVRQTPQPDVSSALAASIQYQLQQYTAGQAAWQQQLRCVNASLTNRTQLHQLAALVQASLAVEGQMAEADSLADLYGQLLRHSNTLPLQSQEGLRSQLELQLSQKGVPARQSGLRAETVQLRTLFFQLLEVMLQGCTTSCSRPRPDAQFHFYVNYNQSLETPFANDAPTATSTATPSTAPSMQMTSGGRRLTTASTDIPAKRMTLDTASEHFRSSNERAVMSELMMDSNAGLRNLSSAGARALLSSFEADASADLWFGYDVRYNSRPVQRSYGSFPPRCVGLRNQVLGGLYFQQDREVFRCRTKYQKLFSTCTETGFYNLTDAQDDINNLTTAARTFFSNSEMWPPLGHDPTFQPASSLWNYALIAREEEYYNTSQASDEVDMKGPHGFFQPLLGGWHTLRAYPTLITTQMSGRRAGDALTYLTDGQYIDDNTHKLYLTLLTYNTIRTALGYTQANIHLGALWRHSSGSPNCHNANCTIHYGKRAVSTAKTWLLMCNSKTSPGLLVYIVYAVVQCVVLQPEPYYGVYDCDNWARARWFLLKRLGLAPDQSADFTPDGFAMFNSTHIPNVPGGANRWRLPQDTSGALIFVYKLLVMNNYTGLRNGLHGGSELVLLNRLESDSYLWAGPLAYLIKTALTAFVIVAVLRPFRVQHRKALAAEGRRPTGLGSSIKHMLLGKWDNIRGSQSRTKAVVRMTERTTDEDFLWWRQARNNKTLVVGRTATDNWLGSLQKLVRRTLADFSRKATCGLITILHSQNFSPDQARPDNLSKPTKGEMAKVMRLLIANARDDEEFFNELGRHWWDYSETIREALGRLFTSRPKVLALLDADKSHVLDLIKEGQRYFEDSAQDVAAVEETATRSVEDVGDRHRRQTLRSIADRARRLALRVTEQQRNKRAETLQVASTITLSIVADMKNRGMRSGRGNRRRSVLLGADAKGPLAAVTKIADAPTKTNSNGKVLARLRSTASTNLISQAPGSLARSSSSLSRDLQLPASGSGTVPSIGRLGSIAAGPPQLNKLAPAVGRGAARRSADLPLQQLMGMQTPGAPRLGRTSSVLAPGMARRSADVPLQQLLDAQRVPTAPRARRASVGGLVPTAAGAEGEMVPYNPRARRTSTLTATQRILPTEASIALPLFAQTIPEDGPFQLAGAGGLARSSSGMRPLGRVAPTSSSSLYRLGSLAALSPSFLGISAAPAPRRATADSDEGVPLGGLAKLGSNVADLMTSLDTSRLQRPSADMNRARAVLGGNADQLLTPPSTNAKSSAESPLAGSSETTASPADVRLSMSPKRRGGSPLQKGTSLAALMDIAESEESHTSSTARLLQAGAATASPKTDDRQPQQTAIGRTRRQSVINRRGSQLMKKVTPKAALIQFTAQASAVVSDLSSQLGDLSMQQAQWQRDLQDQMASVQELIDNIDV